MPNVALADAIRLASRGLQIAGAPHETSDEVAAALGYAEASGLRSHGFSRFPFLRGQVASGKLRATSAPKVQQIGSTVIAVDAGLGFGYTACSRASERLIEVLGSEPIAIATVSNSHHFGVAGQYVERIADAGFLGIAMSGTFGALAPVGGHTPLLGNSPLSLGVPHLPGEPLVIDIAPAVAARGAVVAAEQHGEAIPFDWALDTDGNPTTDPAAALKGTMRAIGGHKGVMLAMLVDLLVATTTNSLLPGEAGSPFTPDGVPPTLGQVFIGIDPTRLGRNPAEVARHYTDMLLGDSETMRVPGQRRRLNRAAAELDGIELPDAILDELRAHPD